MIINVNYTILNNTLRILNQRRQYSISSTKSLARILVFPVTKDKSYVLFKYNDDLLNSNSPLVRFENKLVGLATKGWNKLSDSDKSINKKIVYYVTKLLDATPWREDSLRSIPSESSLLRQLKKVEGGKEADEIAESSQLVSKLELELNDYKDPLVDIPVSYPRSIVSQEHLNAELGKMAQDGIAYHKKHMLIVAMLIPITLPVALVPIVPNVPGFYLAYRFYCNFKAYMGAQHLKELLDKEHLILQESQQLDRLFERVKDETIKINEGVIDDIVELFDVETSRASLLKALKQEHVKAKGGE